MKIDLTNSPSNTIKLKNIESIQYLEYSTKDPNSSHQSAFLTQAQMTIQLIEIKKRLNKLTAVIYDYDLLTYKIEGKLLGELKFYFFLLNYSKLEKFKNCLKFKDFKLFELKCFNLTKKNFKNNSLVEINNNNFEGLEGFLPFHNNFNLQNKDFNLILTGFLKGLRKTLNRKACDAGGVLFGEEIVEINWNPPSNPNSTWYFKGLPHNPDWPTLGETSLKYQLWFNHGTLYCCVNAKKHHTRLIEWDDVKSIASESPALQSDPLNPVINLEFPVQALSSPHLAPVEILGFPFGLTEEVETLILKRWCTLLSLPNFNGPNNCQQPFKKSVPRIPNLTYVRFPKSENQSTILFPTFAIFIPLPDGFYDPIQPTSKTTWNLAWDYTEIYFNMMEYILLNTNQTPQQNNNNLRPIPRDMPHSSINSPQALIPHPPTPSAIDYGRLGRELDTWDYLSSQFMTTDPGQQNQPIHFTPTHIQSLPAGQTETPSEDFNGNFFEDLDLNNFNLNSKDPLHQNLNLGGFDSLDVTDDDFSFFDTKKESGSSQLPLITSTIQSSPKLINLFEEPVNNEINTSTNNGNNNNSNSNIGNNSTNTLPVKESYDNSKPDEVPKEDESKPATKQQVQPSPKGVKLTTNTSQSTGNKRYPTYLAKDYAPIKRFNSIQPQVKLDKLTRIKPKNKLRSDYSPIYNPYNYFKLKSIEKSNNTKLSVPIKQIKKVGKIPQMVKNLLELDSIKLDKKDKKDKLEQVDEKEEGEAANTDDTNINTKSSIEKLLPDLELITKPPLPQFPWVHYGNGLFEDDLSLQVFIDQVQFIPNYTKINSPNSNLQFDQVQGQDHYSSVLKFSKILQGFINTIEAEDDEEEKEEDKKLKIASFLPINHYSNLKDKSYKEDNPILIPYKEPNLRLGYKSNWISVKPSSTYFWDRLDLNPMNSPKLIQYCCLIPSNRDLILECNNFFNNLKYNFQLGNFGQLESLKNINCLKDGYLQISKPLQQNQNFNQQGGQQQLDRVTQEGIATPQTPGGIGQSFDSIPKEAVLDTYFRHASMLSEELSTLNQRETPQNIIIYYVTYSIPLNYQMLFELSSTLTKGIFKGGAQFNNLQIQLIPIPLEFLLSFKNLENTQQILNNFSFNIFNLIFNLDKVGEESNEILKTYSPCFSLIPNLPKKLKFGPDIKDDEFKNQIFFCHITYSLGPNYEYVMVHWTDNTGTQRDFSVIPLPVFNPSKPIPYPLYLHHLWNATQAFVQRSSPWNPDSSNIIYYITKLGKLSKLELEAWRLFWDSTNSLICLFSLLGESNFQLFPNLKDINSSTGGIKMGKQKSSGSSEEGSEVEEEFGFTGNRNRHLILLPNYKYPISPDVIPILMGLILDLPVVPIEENQKVRLNTNLSQNFTSPNYVVLSDTHLSNPTNISTQAQTLQLALIFHTKSDLQKEEIFKNYLKQTSDLSYLNLDFYLDLPNFPLSTQFDKLKTRRLDCFRGLLEFSPSKLPFNWYLMLRTTIALLEGGLAMGDRYLA